MIKILKRINKFLEGLSILLVPIILFYWFLKIIDISALKTVAAMLEYFLNPLLFVVKIFGDFQINYDNKLIDLTPFILASALFIIFFMFSAIEKMLNRMESGLKEAQIKATELKDKKMQEIMREKYLHNLATNRIIFLVLALNKKETETSYLLPKEDGKEDLFTEGMLNKMISKVVNEIDKYNGRKYEKFEGEDGTFRYIFQEVTEAIDFAFFVHNMIFNINKEFLDFSEKMSFIIGVHCNQTEDYAEQDFLTTTKILRLGNPNEIIVSELFKNKYEALKAESNLEFNSYGIYSLNSENIEVFKLKIKEQSI